MLKKRKILENIGKILSIFIFFLGAFIFYYQYLIWEKHDFPLDNIGIEIAEDNLEKANKYKTAPTYRLLTEQEQYKSRKKAMEQGYYSFAPCIVDNLGRELDNPINHGNQFCDKKALLSWIEKRNKTEKDFFNKTGKTIDQTYWENKLSKEKEYYESLPIKKINILMVKIIALGAILFILNLIFRFCLSCIFNKIQKIKDMGIKKQGNKKFLDLTKHNE